MLEYFKSRYGNYFEKSGMPIDQPIFKAIVRRKIRLTDNNKNNEYENQEVFLIPSCCIIIGL
jgi:hypothetical protein